MQRALEETIIEGVKTTIPYHQKIMENKNFKSGVFDTSFLENFTFISKKKEDN
jgi:acetyl-CoA carboxylase biotin carboxylase subunit